VKDPLQQTLEQQRAKRAWEDIQTVMGRSDDFKKKYGSLARRVPMLVLTNGLGQTLAYLRSKGKNDEDNEHNLLFRQLSDWTMSQVVPDNKNDQNQNLLDWILHNNSIAYLQATNEALAYLTWLKRFAEAELPSEGD